MERVVLFLSAKHFDGALQFLLTSDERIVQVENIVDASAERMPVGLHPEALHHIQVVLVQVSIVNVVLVDVIPRRILFLAYRYDGSHQNGFVVSDERCDDILSVAILQSENSIDDMRSVNHTFSSRQCHLFGICKHFHQLVGQYQFVVAQFLRHDIDSAECLTEAFHELRAVHIEYLQHSFSFSLCKET